MQTYNLEIIYTIKSNVNREQFINEIVNIGILDKILNEDGCIFYEYTCPAEKKNLIILKEKWENLEKQQAHLKQEHMKELAKIKDKYIASTQVKQAN